MKMTAANAAKTSPITVSDIPIAFASVGKKGAKREYER
jgi:hypothetical protein